MHINISTCLASPNDFQSNPCHAKHTAGTGNTLEMDLRQAASQVVLCGQRLHL